MDISLYEQTDYEMNQTICLHELDYELLEPPSIYLDYYGVVYTFLERFSFLQEGEIPKHEVQSYDVCIMMLRALNKYEAKFFNMLFDNLYDRMKYLFRSKFPRLAKSAILFISEVFYNMMDNGYNSTWVYELLPELISISCSKAPFVNTFAQDSIKLYSDYVFYEEGIEALLELLTDDNPLISDISFNTLIDVLNNLDEITVQMFRDWVWELLLNQVHELYQKNDRYSNKAVKLIKFLYNQFYLYLDFYRTKLIDCEFGGEIFASLRKILEEDKGFSCRSKMMEHRNEIRLVKYHKKRGKMPSYIDRDRFSEVAYPGDGNVSKMKISLNNYQNYNNNSSNYGNENFNHLNHNMQY
jgi:hypothetical protein